MKRTADRSVPRASARQITDPCVPRARAQDFMVEQGWPNADLPDPWAWVDNDGQPVQGIFERFFMYLARVPDMSTSTYDWVLERAP